MRSNKFEASPPRACGYNRWTLMNMQTSQLTHIKFDSFGYFQYYNSPLLGNDTQANVIINGVNNAQMVNKLDDMESKQTDT